MAAAVWGVTTIAGTWASGGNICRYEYCCAALLCSELASGTVVESSSLDENRIDNRVIKDVKMDHAELRVNDKRARDHLIFI
jgi:hypothetical protein